MLMCDLGYRICPGCTPGWWPFRPRNLLPDIQSGSRQDTPRRGYPDMDVHACIAVRSRPSAGTRVVIYVITVTVVIVMLKAGVPVPDAILAAAGAHWAVGTARQPGAVTATGTAR